MEPINLKEKNVSLILDETRTDVVLALVGVALQTYSAQHSAFRCFQQSAKKHVEH